MRGGKKLRTQTIEWVDIVLIFQEIHSIKPAKMFRFSFWGFAESTRVKKKKRINAFSSQEIS